jgi:hypothetical protein
LQVQLQILDLRKDLVPLGKGLDVNRADILDTFAAQFGDQMAANETASATYHDFISIHNLGLLK